MTDHERITQNLEASVKALVWAGYVTGKVVEGFLPAGAHFSFNPQTKKVFINHEEADSPMLRAMIDGVPGLTAVNKYAVGGCEVVLGDDAVVHYSVTDAVDEMAFTLVDVGEHPALGFRAVLPLPSWMEGEMMAQAKEVAEDW